MNLFRNIPYAAPPVGDLRWKPPALPARWDGIRDVTSPSPTCAQANQRRPSQEDCLYLEVYTPVGSDSSRPVIVYIHGGGLTEGCTGACGEPVPLVEAGAVVVMIAYRLGVFGFLAHPALNADSPSGTSGNYGLLDQLAGLRWVRDNIASFGGDPENVTLLGGSSGGFSIRIMMTSPLAKGLFHKAIVSSGSRREVASREAAERQSTVIISRAGCTDQTLACLRAMSTSRLLEMQAISDPVLDNALITTRIRSGITAGAFERVPVLEGSTLDEGRLDIAIREWTGQPMAAAQYETAVTRISNRGYRADEVSTILTHYPLSRFESPSLAVAKIATDGQYACRARLSARELSKYVPTYQYRFEGAYWPQPRGSMLTQPLSFPLGATHGAELSYVVSGQFEVPTPPAEQQALQAGIVAAYVSFARTGSPGPSWKTYSPEADEVMVFSYQTPQGQPSRSFATEHDCAFWEAQPWWPDELS